MARKKPRWRKPGETLSEFFWRQQRYIDRVIADLTRRKK